MVKVEDLRKTYEGRASVQALKGVTFEIARGEFLAIMGPSGSGKSTLMHLLGLLDSPTSGQIVLDGTDISKLSYHQQSVFRLQELGYIFQEYALLPELNALENVYLPSLLRGTSAKEYIKAGTDLLEMVGLGRRLDHLIRQLSGGEQQRVAIARSLVNKPKILIADEPTANLDSENKEIVLNLLRKLCDELKQTIVMVTHEPEQKVYVDRVIWLRDGLIESQEEMQGKSSR